MLKPQQVEQLISLALKAPSGDNMQPFTYKWDSAGQALFIEHYLPRAEHVFNYKYFADYISLGCVLENIKIWANNNSLDSHEELTLNTGGEFARITFTSSNVHNSFVCEDISRRHTNRFSFTREDLPVSVKNLVEGFQSSTIRCHIISEMDEIADLMAGNDTIPFKNKKIHSDLMTWITWTRQKVGMPVLSLGLDLLDLLSFPLIKFHPISNLMMKLGAAKIVSLKKKVKIRNSSAIILWEGDNDEKSLIEIGRQANLVWLELNKNEFGVQPETMASFVAGHVEEFHQALGIEKMPLEKQKQKFQELTNSRGQLLWMLRTGKAKPLPAKRRSSRFDVKDVLRVA